MPRIEYLCTKCNSYSKKFFSKSKDITEEITCKVCKKYQASRQLSAPSSKSTMTIDNGFQARSTEIIHDIVEMNRDKSIKGGDRGD